MLKLVLVGIWIAMVTAGAAVLSARYLTGAGEAGGIEGASADMEIEEIKTEMTSVPMVRGGEVLGYVIIQLSFAADKAKLAQMKLEPAPFMTDAAFRAIYANEQVDFRRLRRSDLDSLTTMIAQEANARMGADIVRQVLIQQLNFVKREDIRTNWIGRKPESK